MNAIADKLIEYRWDPLAYVLWAFPWGQPGTSLAEYPAPRAWQADLFREIGAWLQDPETRHEPFQAVRSSGHGIGKSAFMGMLLSWALDTTVGTRANITANTEPQLRTKTVPEMTKWRQMSITAPFFSTTATSFYSKARDQEKLWRADFIPWSENRPEAFAGLHNAGKRLLMLMDEGSAISDKIYETAEGALTDENTEILWIVFGNPTRNTGRFRELFRKHSKYWNHAQIDSRDVDGTNKKLIARWEEQYGVDSDWFKVRVRGVFPSMSTRQLYSSDDLDRAYGIHLRREQYDFAPKILACDPAWEGDDELVIGLRQGLQFDILKRMPKNDNDIEVANWIARFETEHEVDCVNIDAGYGTGIVSAGRTIGRNWNLISFSGKSSREDCFNKRAEMYLNTRDLLKDGLALPEIQDLYDEMVAIELLPTLDGKYKIPPKEDIKSLIGRSTDLLDTLVLTTALPVVTKIQRRVNRNKLKHSRTYNPIIERLTKE
jgi:hypothetical protein